MPKILIIRFSSIGDIVLTTPVIRNLRKQIGDIELHYCTQKSFRSIIEHNPYLHKVHYLDNNMGNLIEALKKEEYDYVIDLHNNLRTAQIKLKLRTKAFSFNKLNIQKWLYVNFKINKMPDLHIVDRYMETVEPLNVYNDYLGLDYFIPSADEVKKESLPESHQNGFVAFAIGAQHYTKRLPEEKIIEFCEKINKPLVLLGGKEDKAVGDKIEKHFKTNKSNIIYNACGKYNLNQSASLVKQASLVFSHDTGLMHIAAAFKKEIYSIWGNTTPSLGMYPYLTKFHIIENNDLSCRPCSKIGYSRCPKKHFKCMRDLKPAFEIH
ncbi:glycosyltransferase family 9 protein [Cytophagaceae bacterium ABcell3]|nr:glycosyltransferase family 9 protein [Cytophagaceae bacterium ABcell3]